VPAETLDAAAQGDEARAEVTAAALGKASSAAYDGYALTVPDDVGPAGPLSQPKNVSRFDAATFTWVGGSNAVDNPNVVVQRQLPNGTWSNAANQQGEVESFLALPSGFQSIPQYHAGQIQWKWTANFEAFDPFPAGAASQVVNGVYRFVVDGNIHQGGAVKAYHLESQPFTVSPWGGIQVNDVRVDPGGAVSFVVPPVVYPRTYASTAAPKFIADDHRTDVCKTCSFRPWASTSSAASALVTVVRASGAVQRVAASLVSGRWVASTALQPGDRAFVGVAGVHDTWGEINGAPSATVTG
jgi:hypothetical protein